MEGESSAPKVGGDWAGHRLFGGDDDEVCAGSSSGGDTEGAFVSYYADDSGSGSESNSYMYSSVFGSGLYSDSDSLEAEAGAERNSPVSRYPRS